MVDAQSVYPLGSVSNIDKNCKHLWMHLGTTDRLEIFHVVFNMEKASEALLRAEKHSCSELIEQLRCLPIYQRFETPVATWGGAWMPLSPENLARRLVNARNQVGPGRALQSLMRLLSSEEVAITFSALLRGIRAPGDIELGGGWAAHPVQDGRDPHLQYVDVGPTLLTGDWYTVLTLQVCKWPIIDGPWNVPPTSADYARAPNYQSRFVDALTVMALIGPSSPHAVAFWWQFDDPEFRLAFGDVGVSYDHAEIPYLGQLAPFLTDEFEGLLSAFDRLTDKSRQRLRAALQRLSVAGRRRAVADMALDCAIALETALDTADVRGEVSYRLRLRAALLLGGDMDLRRRAKKIVNDLYSLRSKVVHRGLLGDEKDREVAREGIKLTADVLRKLVIIGDVRDWGDLELRGGLE